MRSNFVYLKNNFWVLIAQIIVSLKVHKVITILCTVQDCRIFIYRNCFLLMSLGLFTLMYILDTFTYFNNEHLFLNAFKGNTCGIQVFCGSKIIHLLSWKPNSNALLLHPCQCLSKQAIEHRNLYYI